MKYNKILAYPLGWTWPIYVEFLSELKERNYFNEAYIVTFLPRIERKLRKTLDGHNSIYYDFVHLTPSSSETNATIRAQLEDKYGIPNLGLLKLVEHRQTWPRLGLEQCILFWEKYLTDKKPDFLITQFPATSLSVSLFLVARQLNIQLVIPQMTRFSGRALLLDGSYKESLYDTWPGLQETYRHYIKTGLSSEQSEAQSEKIHLIGSNKPKPLWATSPVKKKWSNRTKDFLLSLSITTIKRSFELRWRKKITRIGVQQIPNDLFFFFPLHYEPEASLDIWAPFFRHQLSLIEYVHQSLPAEVGLVVKEHPAMFGRRRKSFYRTIAQLSHATLLKVDIDSFDIITSKNCMGVITINSTVGHEAMLMGKPVVSFGNAYYNAADDLVKNVTDLTTLPRILANMRDIRPSKRRLLSFLQSIEDLTFQGLIASGEHESRPILFSKRNIMAIANEFEKRFPSNDKISSCSHSSIQHPQLVD